MSPLHWNTHWKRLAKEMAEWIFDSLALESTSRWKLSYQLISHRMQYITKVMVFLWLSLKYLCKVSKKQLHQCSYINLHCLHISLWVFTYKTWRDLYKVSALHQPCSWVWNHVEQTGTGACKNKQECLSLSDYFNSQYLEQIFLDNPSEHQYLSPLK